MRIILYLAALNFLSCTDQSDFSSAPRSNTSPTTSFIRKDAICEKASLATLKQDVLLCHASSAPKEHADELVSMLKDCFPEVQASINKSSLNQGVPYWIELADGSKSLAYLSIIDPSDFETESGHQFKDISGIFYVCINKDHRGKKLGEALMDFTLKQFHKLHPAVLKIYLDAWEDNLPAIGLYKKCGFKEVGRTSASRRKIGNKTEMVPFVIMEKDLKGPVGCQS